MIGDVLILAGIVLLAYGLFFLGKSGVSQNSDEKQNHAEYSDFENTDEENWRVSGGGVIMIGPIPILFGSDKNKARTLMKLAIALVLLYIILLVLFR